MSFIEKAKKKLGMASDEKDAVSGSDKPVDASAQSTIDKVKGNQGIFDKIQNFFTMGYGTKEDLRELDKKLRDNYYADFKGMRHKWEALYLEALNAKQPGDDYKKVIQVMDRVAEKINRADYGYAGLFDRKGAIKENELAKIFNYDKSFGAEIQVLDQSIDDVNASVEAEAWNETTPKVRGVKLRLLDIEKKWDGREQEFRPVEI
jgi:hypothetical protein